MLEAVATFRKWVETLAMPEKRTKWRSVGTKPRAFSKAILKRRRRNKLARLSRRANRG
jgi:hypothetical protein